MSKSKLSLDGILNLQTIRILKDDASIICEDANLIKQLEDIIKRQEDYDGEEIKDFLKNNKEHINIEQLVLILIIRHSQYIEVIDKKINEILKNNSPKANYDIMFFEKNKKELEKSIRNIKNAYKKIKDEYLAFMQFDEEKNDYYVDVYNSEELIKNSKEKEKNKKKFLSLNEKYKNKYGIDNMLRIFAFGDISRLFDDKYLGNSIMLVSEANIVSKIDKVNLGSIKSVEELHEKSNEILAKHKVSDETDDMVKEDLYRYAKYINIDNFLLIFAYRLKGKLEKEEVVNPEECEDLLKDIYKDVQKDSNISYVLEYYVKNGTEMEEVQQSPSDIKKLMERFINGKYINDETINSQRREILDGNLNLSEVDPSMFKLIDLSTYEIEQIMTYNLENFIYGVETLNYDLTQIINTLNDNTKISKKDAIIKLNKNGKVTLQNLFDLYGKGDISIGFLKEISEEINLSDEVNIEKIIEDYYSRGQQQYTKNEKSKFKTKIDIYKAINLEGKTDEEKDKLSDEIISEIFEDEKAIESFFENGMITLNVLAEWTGEDFVEKLFNENKIKISDIEELYNKEKVSNNFLERLIIKDNPDIDLMVNYMKKGYISESNIIKIFENSDVYRKEADELFKNGIISKETYEIILNRDIQKIAKRVGNPIEGIQEERENMEDEIEIPRKISHDDDSPLPYNENAKEDEFIDYELTIPQATRKSDIRTERSTENKGSSGGGKTKKLINPLVRYEFLKALKRKMPRSINYEGMGEKNPFYNYNFYIIKNNNTENEIARDDIIVAERFYTDRENKTDFAMDNATYVMRFEDYLILTGKQKENGTNNKRGAIKEVPGAVYVVNHRDGTWAKSLLRAISQAKLGQSLKSIKNISTREKVIEGLEDLYSDEEILEIINLAVEIDRGEYTYIEKNGKFVNINDSKSQPDNLDGR